MGKIKLKVLVCPAHYMVDDQLHGSEYAWPVGFLKACVDIGGIEFVAVAGNVGSRVSISSTSLISLKTNTKDMLSVVGVARFVFEYTRAALQIIKSWKPDIIHHMLPFRAGGTFNPVIMAGPSAKTVVGPIQSSHRVRLDDESGVAVGEYRALRNGVNRRTPTSWGIVGSVSSVLCRQTLRRANVVLAANQSGAAAASRAGARAPIIVPFGVDDERFARAGLSVRMTSGGRAGVTFIVVAYLVARKRVSDVIRAFAMILKNYQDARLLIVGDGPERGKLIALAQQLGVDAACELVGYVPHKDMALEYSRADVLISGSASETFGMSLLEAMACGLPIISTDNDGSGDIISTGKNGYLFKVGDIEALAHFMEILCIDRNLRKDMGMSALDCIKTKYSWKKIAAQIREVYIS